MLYGPVTLHNGTQADSGSEAWRLECLVRWLNAMPPDQRRAMADSMNPLLVRELRRLAIEMRQSGK